MATFEQVNNFVVNHCGKQYFDADVKLYKKHFPNSSLIKELDRAPEYAKKNLDERIIFEILNNQDSCIDCIWENRGFVRDNKEAVLPLKPKQPKIKEAKIPLENKETDISDIMAMSYNELKQTVFSLNLDKMCQNHKTDTYRNILANYKLNILNVPVPTQDDKKKEDRE